MVPVPRVNKHTLAVVMVVVDDRGPVSRVVAAPAIMMVTMVMTIVTVSVTVAPASGRRWRREGEAESEAKSTGQRGDLIFHDDSPLLRCRRIDGEHPDQPITYAREDERCLCGPAMWRKCPVALRAPTAGSCGSTEADRSRPIYGQGRFSCSSA